MLVIQIVEFFVYVRINEIARQIIILKLKRLFELTRKIRENNLVAIGSARRYSTTLYPKNLSSTSEFSKFLSLVKEKFKSKMR